MTSAGALRWVERLAAVALGSLLTLWWTRDVDDAPQEASAVPAAAAAPLVSAAADVAPAREQVPIEMPAVREPASAEERGAPSPRDVVDPIREPAPASDAPVDVADASAPVGEAPVLPLPRMPGSARLSDAARFDSPTNTWVLRGSYRVHAHVPHVLAFYTKALEDAGLVVTQGEDPERPDGTKTVYLYGRSDRVRAQVSVRTQGTQLDARIGLLWRARQ